MARSSWKYLYLTNFNILNYLEYFIEEYRVENSIAKRHTTLHNLNYFLPYTIYTGKWTIQKKFTKYHLNFKLGEFTKTRKPYFFRSKKKRICYK